MGPFDHTRGPFDMHTKFRAVLLAGVTLLALRGAAFAAAKPVPQQPDPAAQARLDSLQQQIQDLNIQLQQIKQAQAVQAQAVSDADATPALSDLKRSTSDQYVDLNNQLAAQNKPSVDNGRLQITSADGRFSAALRLTAQYDTRPLPVRHRLLQPEPCRLAAARRLWPGSGLGLQFPPRLSGPVGQAVQRLEL